MSDKSKKNIDPKPIKDLAKILEELNLTEVSYSDGDFSVTVAKGARLQSVDKDTSIQNNSEKWTLIYNININNILYSNMKCTLFTILTIVNGFTNSNNAIRRNKLITNNIKLVH